LSIENLTFCYSKASAPVCKDFSLDLADGSIVAILGKNGTGKTTLLRLVAGLERPTTADGTGSNPNSSIEIFEGADQLVRTNSATWRECMTRHASLVFQQYADIVFEWQKVDKALQWVRSGQDHYYFNVVNLFPALTVPAAESKYWGELSGGQKQALALARGLLRDPDILLMDEPLSSIDTTLRYSVEESLVRIHATLRKKHAVVVLVTHDIDEAVFVANRILIVSGPPLRIVRDIPSGNTPLDRRDRTYRWSADFVQKRKEVFEAFTALSPSGL
jgi:ABC-type nitrate/sulfonate/bicarbonate transport system ATPase subunit